MSLIPQVMFPDQSAIHGRAIMLMCEFLNSRCPVERQSKSCIRINDTWQTKICTSFFSRTKIDFIKIFKLIFRPLFHRRYRVFGCFPKG